ncbi:hypothetical protein [Thermofilum sp.]|uniref:hypothetical protein n=1 Tax=Thermofilum sp. TaxID=1961369 RepID=UPI003161992D
MSKTLGTVLIILGVFVLLFINILLGIPLIIAGFYLRRKTQPPAYMPPQAPYGFYYPQPVQPPPPPPPPPVQQQQPMVAQRYVCPNCGQLLSGRESYCPRCGVRLS